MMRKLKLSMVFSCSILVIRLLALPAGADPKEQPPGLEQKASVQVQSSESAPAVPPGKAKGLSKDNDGDAGNGPTVFTEDNDTNDSGTPNNVSDDGDNAHPSGKDKSVEHGKSLKNPNQGKSESDPDNDGHGPDRGATPADSGKGNKGADKPNGKGGVDRADQDGNNGCGNDDDFEDDNEGWCGHKPKKSKASKPSHPSCNGSSPNRTACQSPEAGKPDKVTICHATGSEKNPFVTITVSERALKGHGGHAGDIIPAPAGGCPTGPGDSDGKKVSICHATGSDRNPYVLITVNENALKGHGGHAGDIIPAPAGGCPTGGTGPASPGSPGEPGDPGHPGDPNDPKDVVHGPGVKPEVKADDVVRQRPGLVPEVQHRGPTGLLPFTGGDLLDYLLIAFAGIIMGLLLTRWAKDSI